MEAQVQMEHDIKLREQAGKMKVYKGNPKIWQVLDESFESDARKRAQLDVRDPKALQTDVSGQRRRDDALGSDAEEDFIEVPIRTKYYD